MAAGKWRLRIWSGKEGHVGKSVVWDVTRALGAAHIDRDDENTGSQGAGTESSQPTTTPKKNRAPNSASSVYYGAMGTKKGHYKGISCAISAFVADLVADLRLEKQRGLCL